MNVVSHAASYRCDGLTLAHPTAKENELKGLRGRVDLHSRPFVRYGMGFESGRL